jgi:GT2 family glycosyltransferase
MKLATGKYIFLIDDDNVLDEHCVSNLVHVLEKDSSVGMVGPVNYALKTPERVTYAGTKRNMFTSLSKFPGTKAPLPDLETWETDDFPNAWMLRREIVDKNIMFDEAFKMHYEESDFAYRVRRRLGYRFLIVKKARIYHDVDGNSAEFAQRRWLDRTRVRNTGKNRVLFHRRHSTRIQYIIFLLIWCLPVTVYYLYSIWRMDLGSNRNRIRSMIDYAKGTIAGFGHDFR